MNQPTLINIDNDFHDKQYHTIGQEDISTASGITVIDSSNQPEMNEVSKYLNLEEPEFQPKLEESFEMKQEELEEFEDDFQRPEPNSSTEKPVNYCQDVNSLASSLINNGNFNSMFLNSPALQYYAQQANQLQMNYKEQPLKKNMINKMIEKSKRILKREKAKSRKKGNNQIDLTYSSPQIEVKSEVEMSFSVPESQCKNMDNKSQKKMLQMIRNRISAQNSRDRKKAYITKLESDADNAISENTVLKQQIEQIKKDKKLYMEDNERLRKEKRGIPGQTNSIDIQEVNISDGSSQICSQLQFGLITLVTFFLFGDHNFESKKKKKDTNLDQLIEQNIDDLENSDQQQQQLVNNNINVKQEEIEEDDFLTDRQISLTKNNTQQLEKQSFTTHFSELQDDSEMDTTQ